jgi:Cu(I)/Ag(I) efflux system membrane fusion protein
MNKTIPTRAGANATRLNAHHARLALMLITLLAAFFAAGCKESGTNGKPDNVDYYTCTMHPSVRSQDPHGKCPICGMELVPVLRKNLPSREAPHAGPATPAPLASSDEVPTAFTVPVARQQQFGVTFASIEKQPLHFAVRAVGTVASDKARQWDYVARVDGYVQKLFVFSRGEVVEKDAPLLTLYSPDLLTTENEFIDVLKTRDTTADKGDKVVRDNAERLVESAKERLRLWNVSEQQITELEKTRQPKENLTLRSPFKGVVQDLGVEQGRRTTNGDRLVAITDLSVVWVWAEFYENEIALLRKELPVTISTTAYPQNSFRGKIALIDPFLNAATRTTRVRINVDNPDLRLRPDMYVNIDLQLDMGDSLTVPVSAVVPTGKRDIVFISRGEGKLQPCIVELGRKFGDFYEIKSGLKEGERVVNSANFLIDAEAKVQGALTAW